MSSRGFTLIELISVILILGIVSAGIFGFIGQSAEIYVDTTERDQILSDSRFLIERTTRELRQALPNSVREARSGNIQCIEFVPIQWSSFYLDVPAVTENASRFVETIPLGVSADGYVYQNGDSAVVFPRNTAVVYANPGTGVDSGGTAFASGQRFLLSASSTLDTLSQVLKMQFASVPPLNNGMSRFTQDSPASRLYVVGTPVSYCANADTNRITRHNGYGFNPTQVVNPNIGVLMAENLNNNFDLAVPFRVEEAVLTRNAVVHMRLQFDRNEERVEFNYEVHVPNAP